MALAPASNTNIDSHPYDWLEHRLDLKPDEIERRRRDWLHAALEESLHWMEQSEEVLQQEKHLRFLMGQQWDAKRPTYKSSAVNNRLLRTMEETVAVLTDIRTSYDVKALNETFNKQAEVLSKTSKVWWVNQDVDMSMAMAVIYAYLSTGYLRIVWNPEAMNRVGDWEVHPEGINSVLPIGPSYRLQNWEGVIYRSVRPLAWFRRKYGTAGWKVRPSSQYARYTKQTSRPSFIGSTPFEMLSPQMQRWVGTKSQTIESVVAQAEYFEFWIRDYSLNTSENEIQMGAPAGSNWCYTVRPGELLYPRGRVIVAGGEDLDVVHDGPNPHWHARWPFIAIRLKPVPWQFHGISELRTKIPHQEIINHLIAGTLDMIKKALNPPLLFPANAFSPGVQAAMDPNMPGAKLGYNPMSIQVPQYARPPELPNYVNNMLQYMQNEMDDDSGLLDLPGLARKRVTPAGDTLSQLKESQQTIMRLRGRYMEYAVRELGEQMVPNFMQRYTLKRRMHMHGSAGVTFEDVFDYNPKTLIPNDVEPRDFINNFAFQVTPGSLLNVNRQEHATLAMALRRQGDMSLKSLLETLDMGTLYEKIKRELREEETELMQRAFMAKQQDLLSGILGGIGGGGGGIGGKGSRNPRNLLTAE